jgi:hypothetical protein
MPLVRGVNREIQNVAAWSLSFWKMSRGSFGKLPLELSLVPDERWGVSPNIEIGQRWGDHKFPLGYPKPGITEYRKRETIVKI